MGKKMGTKMSNAQQKKNHQTKIKDHKQFEKEKES